MALLSALIAWVTPLVAGVDDALIVAAAAALIGAGIKTGVAIHNSNQAKKAKRAADRTIGALNAENASNYYADYYRGALDNDSTRAYLKRLDAAMKKNNRALDNTIVSAGATNENKLAQKQAKNEVMGNAMAGAVQHEDARKRALQNNYFNRKSGYTLQQMRNDQIYSQQKQQNLAEIAGGVADAIGAIGSIYGASAGSGGAHFSRPAGTAAANAKASSAFSDYANSAYGSDYLRGVGQARMNKGLGLSN